MKKILLTVAIVSALIQPANASILDFCLGANTLFLGVNTIGNTFSMIQQAKMMQQMTQSMQMQNAVYQQQAESYGYDMSHLASPLTENKIDSYIQRIQEDVQVEEAKAFLRKQRDIAKDNNDTEMLELIKRCWKFNKYSALYAKREVEKLLESREVK